MVQHQVGMLACWQAILLALFPWLLLLLSTVYVQQKEKESDQGLAEINNDSHYF